MCNHLRTVPVTQTEISGTLKNVVALAAGFVDGLGLGPNTKAAILRAGLDEMRRFAKAQYPSVRDETFLLRWGIGGHSTSHGTATGGERGLASMHRVCFVGVLLKHFSHVLCHRSCGFSDLVASSYGGRNRLVAMEWTKRQVSGQPATFNEVRSPEYGCRVGAACIAHAALAGGPMGEPRVVAALSW